LIVYLQYRFDGKAYDIRCYERWCFRNVYDGWWFRKQERVRYEWCRFRNGFSGADVDILPEWINCFIGMMEVSGKSFHSWQNALLLKTGDSLLQVDVGFVTITKRCWFS